MPTKTPTESRFWHYAKKTDGCWLWTGAKNYAEGYGVIKPSGSRKAAYAHRLSYEMAFGPVPKGLWVLHKCDVPSCVNPAHLFLGNRGDNMRDAKAKGRAKWPVLLGEKNPFAKLTVGKVKEIREGAAEGKSQSFLATEFDVSRTTIRAILLGTRWKLTRESGAVHELYAKNTSST